MVVGVMREGGSGEVGRGWRGGSGRGWRGGFDGGWRGGGNSRKARSEASVESWRVWDWGVWRGGSDDLGEVVFWEGGLRVDGSLVEAHNQPIVRLKGCRWS